LSRVGGNLGCGFLVAGKFQTHALDCRGLEQEIVLMQFFSEGGNDEERARKPDALFRRERGETDCYFLAGAL
jgi:hypothetical protein